MKKIFLMLLMAATADADHHWVTTIDGQIYETPMPYWSHGMSIKGCTVHEVDRWVELHTYDPADVIFETGFEV